MLALRRWGLKPPSQPRMCPSQRSRRARTRRRQPCKTMQRWRTVAWITALLSSLSSECAKEPPPAELAELIVLLSLARPYNGGEACKNDMVEVRLDDNDSRRDCGS